MQNHGETPFWASFALRARKIEDCLPNATYNLARSFAKDKLDFLPLFLGLETRGNMPSPFPHFTSRLGIVRFLRLYLIRESSDIDRDSSEATKGGESIRGRGIDVTIALFSRRGVLEETPREIQEKEERNCDIKGRDELGTGEGCILGGVIASGGNARMLRGLSCPFYITGPMPGECPMSAVSALLKPEDTSAVLDLHTSSLGVNRSPLLHVPRET